MEKEEGGEGRRRRLGKSAATARVRVGDPDPLGGAESGHGRGPSTAAPLAFLLQVAQNFAPRLLADCIPCCRLPQPLKEAKAEGDSWASAELSLCSKEAGTRSSC